MGKIFKKTRCESNDDLPLNKPIKLRLLTITIRSVKFYPQLFLDDVCLNYKSATGSKN